MRVNSALSPPPGLMDYQPMSPMLRDNWSKGILRGTCTGKSSLYTKERFQSDPFKNPFLQSDTMNCPDHPQPILTSGKRRLESMGPSLSSEPSLFGETPSKTGIWFGTPRGTGEFWISQPKFE